MERRQRDIERKKSFIYLHKFFSYNEASGTITAEEKTVELDTIQKEILKLLMKNPNEVIPYEEFNKVLRESGVTGSNEYLHNTLGREISELRNFIGIQDQIQAPDLWVIGTVIGRSTNGYILNGPIKKQRIHVVQ